MLFVTQTNSLLKKDDTVFNMYFMTEDLKAGCIWFTEECSSDRRVHVCVTYFSDGISEGRFPRQQEHMLKRNLNQEEERCSVCLYIF